VDSRVGGCRDTAADGEDSICWHWVVDAGAGILRNMRRGVVDGWRAGVYFGLDWADCRGEGNGRGDDSGVVGRAVGDSGSTVSDCD